MKIAISSLTGGIEQGQTRKLRYARIKTQNPDKELRVI